MASKEKIISLAEDANFRLTAKSLYGKCDFYNMAERFVALGEQHVKTFEVNSFEFFSSPGRIELCGNHTDHNNGKVLCASITVDTLGAVTATGDMHIRIASLGYPVIDIDINDLEKNKFEEGTSTALVRGVAKYIQDKGFSLGGFVATTTSNVFKGAGVSSSAAFEVLVAEIINALYNNGNIDPITLAKASQWAESYYFNKPCGLMDQSAIALGGVSSIDFENPEEPTVEHIDWIFDNMDIILINTGGDHTALTADYAAIKSEMEEIAKFFGKKVLREVSIDKFFESIKALKDSVSGRAILRAMHYYEENCRVKRCAEAVKTGNDVEFFDIINNSGDSSFKLLQNCYVPSDTSEHIPLAIELTRRIEGVRAVRVHGGGFAGTVIVFADNNKTTDICRQLISYYGDDNVFTVSVRNSGATATGLKYVKE